MKARIWALVQCVDDDVHVMVGQELQHCLETLAKVAFIRLLRAIATREPETREDLATCVRRRRELDEQMSQKTEGILLRSVLKVAVEICKSTILLDQTESSDILDNCNADRHRCMISNWGT